MNRYVVYWLTCIRSGTLSPYQVTWLHLETVVSCKAQYHVCHLAVSRAREFSFLNNYFAITILMAVGISRLESARAKEYVAHLSSVDVKTRERLNRCFKNI